MNRGGKKFGQKFGHKKEAPQSKEDLDREMESYWIKAGNKELGKGNLQDIYSSPALVTKRLDNELDSYFAAAAPEKQEAAPADDAAVS